MPYNWGNVNWSQMREWENFRFASVTQTKSNNKNIQHKYNISFKCEYIFGDEYMYNDNVNGS